VVELISQGLTKKAVAEELGNWKQITHPLAGLFAPAQTISIVT